MVMVYDRDSFLAGLAVGRTLWRPHRDYGEAPEPWGWDVIEHSTGTIQRSEYRPNVDAWFDKGDINGYWAWVADSSLPSGYYLQSRLGANTVCMFDSPVPARFNRLLIDVDVIGNTGGWNVSSLSLVDEYGIASVYNGWVGNTIRRAFFTRYHDPDWVPPETVEFLSNQPYVDIDITSPNGTNLTRQTVIIDISEVDEPLYVGLHKCDAYVTLHSIRAL